jgi:hypothetical protein
MTKGDETLAAMLVRGRKNLAAMERVAARPTTSPEARSRLGQVIPMQAELNGRIAKALTARGLDPNQVR